MRSAHEQYSDQFHEWEKRGRGWKVFDYPVSIEPPFRRFVGHSLPRPDNVDDGRRPTFLSSLFESLAQGRKKDVTTEIVEESLEEEPDPKPLIRDELSELQIFLSPDAKLDDDVFHEFLLTLAHCRRPIALEVLGRENQITMHFVADTEDIPLLRRQLLGHFPEISIEASEDTLKHAWGECTSDEALVVDFGLSREFMFPLTLGKMDSLVGITAALDDLASSEIGLFQVLFEPVRNEWAKSVLRSVSDADGSPFFVNAPELAEAAREKVASPLFAVVVRIAVKSDSFDRSVQMARDLAGSLRSRSNPGGNELIPLENRDYPIQTHIEDVIARQSRRPGMILNSAELLGFVHLPSSAVRTKSFSRITGKTKAAPATVRHELGILLGSNVHAQKSTSVRLIAEQRVRHMHVIGATGTGKSTFMFNLICQDLQNGEGLAVLDPHGDLIDQVLTAIPKERAGDVVLVDLSDTEFSVGFNILSAHSDVEKTLLASDLVSIFQRLSTSWGDQMESVFRNAILAFLESDLGGSLSDLRRFLVEPSFRERFLKTVRDPDIVYYWRKGFAQLSGNKSIGSVLTRLESFLAPKPIRYMVSQTANRLNFSDLLDNGKIFLAKLPQGLIGRENAFLLGSLLVAKFQQLAMSRQAQRAEARRDFWLYIDEFHNFITPSMTEILTGARKYRLGLILAHQELRQLDRDREVASAVLSNTFTRVVFRVGDSDASSLEDGFSFFDARDLQNLDIGRAICRVERSENDFNLTVANPIKIGREEGERMRLAVIEASRAKYATGRALVEKGLLDKLSSEDAENSKKERNSPPRTGGKNAETLFESAKTQTTSTNSGSDCSSTEIAAAIPEVPAKDPYVPLKEEAVSIPVPDPPIVKDMGIGGAQHQALQQRIKCAAEALGLGATIEQQILNRAGSVDIVLEGKGLRIACEISITTTIDHEVGNVRKCFKAGFFTVAVICTSEDRLRKIQSAIDACVPDQESKAVSYYLPDGFLQHLRSLAQSAVATPPVIPLKLGKYKVTTLPVSLTSSEAKAREELAVKMIAETMRTRKK